MTAEEQLRERVEQLTEEEEEAEAALRLLDRRTDDLTRLRDEAPDDESTTPKEQAAVQEALEAAAHGETISLEELRAELDAERR